MKVMTKVAGVTFANDEKDGGRSRQEILKELATSKGSIITVNLYRTNWLNPKTGKYEHAIKCVEHDSKEVIGWIPKTDIDKIKEKQMTGFIGFVKGTYNVALDVQKCPTQAQYHAMKDICKSTGIPMPAYDVRAYAPVFAQAKATVNA